MIHACDLPDRARRALLQAGFDPDFPPQAEQELRALASLKPSAGQDLTAFLWSSIDNDDSRDLDQIEYAEPAPNGAIRLLVGIADVASYVRRKGALDSRAARNAVTIYTAGKVFPMLPEELSTYRTSLNPNAIRQAVVVEMLVEADGRVDQPKVYPALVQNRARLTYDQVAAWVEGHREEMIDSTPGLGGQLRLQFAASERLIALRKELGALTLSAYEAKPVVKNGNVVDLRLIPHNRARDLIESFMVAANVGTAAFLKGKRWPIIERVVRAPKRWDRIRQIAQARGIRLPKVPAPKPLSEFLAAQREKDPAGFRDLSLSIVKLLGSGEYVIERPDGPQTSHFGLAVDDYSHSTAPNRRYADLVLQRLLFASFAGQPLPCSIRQLELIAARCTEREKKARKIERLMRKIAAACLISERIGESFDAIVTGASPKGTYVRLLEPPVEGKVIRGERGMDVGDRVRVKLAAIDAERGFIDFERD